MGASGIKSGIFEVVKAVLIALAFCLVAVLLFAFIIKIAALPSEVITPVNQGIKSLAVLLGCIVGLGKEKGWLKGGIVGLLTIALAYLIFSLISGTFTFGVAILLELIFGVVIGVISGVVAVNMHK